MKIQKKIGGGGGVVGGQGQGRCERRSEVFEKKKSEKNRVGGSGRGGIRSEGGRVG